MKSIEITGKRNIDKMNNVKNPQRKNVANGKIDECYFTYLKQIQIINSLYLEQSFSNILGEEKHTHVPKTDLNFPPLVLILENPNTPFHIFFL